MPDAIRVDHRDLLGAQVLELHGVLDGQSYGALRTALVKAAIDEPRAVIVDLEWLAVPSIPALALFPSVHDQIAQWPGVPLLVVVGGEAPTGQVDEFRLGRYVPVFGSVMAAAAAIDDPPPRRIARRKLPNSLASAALARRFVLDVCSDWPVGPHVQAAVVIANELVENTLLHTYSAPTLRLELRRELLTIAVYDDDPATARLVELDPAGGSHRGLMLVAQLSRAWGCAATLSGGKVVWAVLRAQRTK
ncbi:MAG TPA: hypothetical protein VGP26_15050 [Actinophytocola sp.]|jgi:hypothetical protein|nr:hypothetical protein [Actinophytocola sp.]